MRSVFALAVMSVALGPDDRTAPWEPGPPCQAYQAEADHFATALERVADCMKQPTDAQSIQCINRVLAEAEL